jgi:hypothetical protein
MEVKSVLQKCSMALSRLLLSQMTVSRVFYMLIGNQGKLIMGKADKAFEPFVHDTKTMIRKIRREPHHRRKSSAHSKRSSSYVSSLCDVSYDDNTSDLVEFSPKSIEIGVPAHECYLDV